MVKMSGNMGEKSEYIQKNGLKYVQNEWKYG